jgi:hypothetical protein
MDAVAPLMPSDKTAGRVAARGEHFEWRPQGTVLHSADPLRLRQPTLQELGQPSFKNLTGARIGRLSVLGIAADVVTSNGTNWAVRCVCGSYETRKARYIKACVAGEDTGEHEPMCSWCGNTRRLQMGKCDEKKAAAAAEAIMAAAR